MRHNVVRALSILTLVLTACTPAAQPSPVANSTDSRSGAKQEPAKSTASGSIILLSTQFRPVEEAEKMRQVILKDAPVATDYIPEDNGPFTDRIIAEQKANRVTVSLIGGLHGDFAPFIQADYMENLSSLLSQLGDRGFAPSFVRLSRMGTPDAMYYVPWMQATYVLAVNKKALPYLPQGADLNSLTYEQLEQWGANIQRATSQRRLGFPAGPQGLIHRFFQGYLYPSFTGSAGVVEFRSPEAVAMWQAFKNIWQYVNPQSTNYAFMQEPLLGEEVWIAWDHTARLINAARERPEDFVLVPAPSGPKGRGFMPVLAGLGIPKGAPNRAGAEALIDFLTRDPQQVQILRELAFFPVTRAAVPTELAPGVRLEAEAVSKQAAAPDALPSLLPIGLGAKNGEFNKVFLDTFQRVVLRGEPIQPVLDEHARILQGIMDETKAGCWPPDAPSGGPCLVK
ncbi:MAG: ABC transporter substrate-binding protein [Chloroflexota bacterium]